MGSHRLHPSAEPRVRALLDELLGADLQERRRNGRLHLAGRWVAFPLRPVNVVRTVPLGVGARIATDVVTGPLRRPRDGSYAEFVRAGLGPTALATFHGPMATKLWGCDPSALSADLAPPAHRRQRRRPPAASRRPRRQAGGTHVPLPAPRLRRGRRPPRRISGRGGRANRDRPSCGGARARSAGALSRWTTGGGSTPIACCGPHRWTRSSG